MSLDLERLIGGCRIAKLRIAKQQYSIKDGLGGQLSVAYTLTVVGAPIASSTALAFYSTASGG